MELCKVYLLLQIFVRALLVNGIQIGANYQSTGGTDIIVYTISETRTSWQNALISCTDKGGFLASPSTPELDESLRTYLASQNFAVNDKIWLGGRVIFFEGGVNWQWVPRRPVIPYMNFLGDLCQNPIPGSGLYWTTTESGAWGWCTISETEQLKYVCEFDNTLTSTTPRITTPTGPIPTGEITSGPATSTESTTPSNAGNLLNRIYFKMIILSPILLTIFFE